MDLENTSLYKCDVEHEPHSVGCDSRRCEEALAEVPTPPNQRDTTSAIPPSGHLMVEASQKAFESSDQFEWTRVIAI